MKNTLKKQTNKNKNKIPTHTVTQRVPRPPQRRWPGRAVELPGAPSLGRASALAAWGAAPGQQRLYLVSEAATAGWQGLRSGVHAGIRTGRD